MVEPPPICKSNLLLEVEAKITNICNHHLAIYWGWSSHPYVTLWHLGRCILPSPIWKSWEFRPSHTWRMSPKKLRNRKRYTHLPWYLKWVRVYNTCWICCTVPGWEQFLDWQNFKLWNGHLQMDRIFFRSGQFMSFLCIVYIIYPGSQADYQNNRNPNVKNDEKNPKP